MPIIRNLHILADKAFGSRKSWRLAKPLVPVRQAPSHKISMQIDVPAEWQNFKVIKSRAIEANSAGSKLDTLFTARHAYVPLAKVRPTEFFYPHDQTVKRLASKIKANRRFKTPLVQEHKGYFYVLDGHDRTSAVKYELNKRTLPVTVVRLQPRSRRAAIIQRRHKLFARQTLS